MVKTSIKSKNQYILQDQVAEKFKMLENEHFSKWAMMKAANKPSVIKPDGRQTSYGDTDFSGSARGVYWSPDYIPEYIRGFIAECIDGSIENSHKHDTHPNKALDELYDIFRPHITKAFQRMADIDSRLTGNGYKQGAVKNTSALINNLENYLEQRIKAFKLSKIDSFLWYTEWAGQRITKIRNIVAISGIGIVFSYSKEILDTTKQLLSF